MSIESQMEREEEDLQDDLDSGRISVKEYNEAMRDLQRSYQAAAEESAQDAYDSELARW